MSEHILLFSGGLDSYIGYHYLKEELGLSVTPLYVNLNHRYNYFEELAIHRLETYGFIENVVHDHRLSLADKEEADAHIPMRNSFLAHIAALYGDNIWLVVQKGEMDLPDRSPAFFEEISRLLTLLKDRSIKVSTPFSELSKKDMVKWYKEKGLPLEGLKCTHSCYNPRDLQPCGNCGACFRRWVAMSLNDISERYATNPWEAPVALLYLKRAKEGYYDKERNIEILAALAKAGVNIE